MICTEIFQVPIWREARMGCGAVGIRCICQMCSLHYVSATRWNTYNFFHVFMGTGKEFCLRVCRRVPQNVFI